jgi:deoxyribodipyrimidine photolyase-related protein
MKVESAALVYPHQLWENNPAVLRSNVIFLIEDPLFFSHYNFHCQKLVLHRASMTEFAANCEGIA